VATVVPPGSAKSLGAVVTISVHGTENLSVVKFQVVSYTLERLDDNRIAETYDY